MVCSAHYSLCFGLCIVIDGICVVRNVQYSPNAPAEITGVKMLSGRHVALFYRFDIGNAVGKSGLGYLLELGSERDFCTAHPAHRRRLFALFLFSADINENQLHLADHRVPFAANVLVWRTIARIRRAACILI